MRRRIAKSGLLPVLALTLTLAGTLPARAEGLRLGQALRAAQAWDPAYRAAGHQRAAAAEDLPIAQGQLLPQVALSASVSGNAGWRRLSNGQNQAMELPLDYTSPQATLSLRWPLVHLEGLAAVDQARAQDELAEQQYRADGLNLLDRLVGAYLEALEAQAADALLQRQVEAAVVITAQAERRERDGEGTRVATAREQASLGVLRSRALQARGRLEIAREALRRLTGLESFEDPVLPAADLPLPPPADLQAWLALAAHRNPMLRAREWAVAAAEARLSRERAGHAPKLDLVGAISHASNDALSTIGQTSQVRSLGLQLQLPLFSGGSVSASIRQAQARLQATQEELRREQEQLRLDLGRLWQQRASARARVYALHESLQASELALTATRRALALGLGTQADEAAQQSSDVDLRQQLVQARLEAMLAGLRLQIRAGLPAADVAAGMDALWPPATAGAALPGPPAAPAPSTPTSTSISAPKAAAS